MLEGNVSHIYWRQVVNTIVYRINKVKIIQATGKTPYELWFGHTPIVKWVRIFGNKYYIKREDGIGMFDPRSDEGIFLGYSLEKGMQMFNQRLRTIVEGTNVKVDKKFKIQEGIIVYESCKDENINKRSYNQNVEKEFSYEIDNNLKAKEPRK